MTKKKIVPTANYNKTVGAWFYGQGYSPEKDNALVGIEIEVEGGNLPKAPFQGWIIHEDGSLRGESAEYVFRTPATETTWKPRLDLFRKTLADANAQVRESYRTSVHVHLNAKPMLIRDVYNLITLYILYEDALGYIAGSDRVGNLFCLRASDAQYFIDTLRDAIQRDNLNVLTGDNLRYSAVNPAALERHGSIEFRALRGTVDIDIIKNWVEILLTLRRASMTEFASPVDICQQISSIGVPAVTNMIFSKGQVQQFNEGWEKRVFDNLRLVQHVAFAREWLQPSEEPKKDDNAGLEPDFEEAVEDNVGFQELVGRVLHAELEAAPLRRAGGPRF